MLFHIYLNTAESKWKIKNCLKYLLRVLRIVPIQHQGTVHPSMCQLNDDPAVPRISMNNMHNWLIFLSISWRQSFCSLFFLLLLTLFPAAAAAAGSALINPLFTSCPAPKKWETWRLAGEYSGGLAAKEIDILLFWTWWWPKQGGKWEWMMGLHPWIKINGSVVQCLFDVWIGNYVLSCSP